jgi:hypothetical protein
MSPQWITRLEGRANQSYHYTREAADQNTAHLNELVKLRSENAALREELKSSRKLVDNLIIKSDAFDYLAWLEKKLIESAEVDGTHFLCLASDGTTCWGKTYLEAVRIAEQHDRIAFDDAARKEGGAT